jgi:hypothetical protein
MQQEQDNAQVNAKCGSTRALACLSSWLCLVPYKQVISLLEKRNETDDDDDF